MLERGVVRAGAVVDDHERRHLAYRDALRPDLRSVDVEEQPDVPGLRLHECDYAAPGAAMSTWRKTWYRVI
jgi:hypothetical protein